MRFIHTKDILCEVSLNHLIVGLCPSHSVVCVVCSCVKVSSHLGEQFLLQAETSNLLNEWYSTIQSAIDLAVSWAVWVCV